MKGKFEKEGGWVDISQPLHNGMRHWPGDTPFDYTTAATKEETGSVNVGRITTSVHMGTHADAPFHFADDGTDILSLDVNVYIGKAAVVDVSGHSEINSRLFDDVEIEGTRRLLLKTSSAGTDAFPESIPNLSAELGPFLKEKGVVLVGVDVPSVDPLDSKELPAHHSFAENGIHILENLVLKNISPGSYELIALPLAIKGSDGSPVRAVLRSSDS
ncbi:arylformamidase [Bacillus marinisedimentorum]|uniref:arylformamidase n=1 Tax=Bacillus marinisedimentorum TaxID=1821260 RepID=UPI000871F6C3|nr:arylformamidase [Bacillus marinisedimentorum]